MDKLDLHTIIVLFGGTIGLLVLLSLYVLVSNWFTYKSYPEYLPTKPRDLKKDMRFTCTLKSKHIYQVLSTSDVGVVVSIEGYAYKILIKYDELEQCNDFAIY